MVQQAIKRLIFFLFFHPIFHRERVKEVWAIYTGNTTTSLLLSTNHIYIRAMRIIGVRARDGGG